MDDVDSNVCACCSSGGSVDVAAAGDDCIVKSNSRDRLLALLPSPSSLFKEELDASERRFRDGNKYSIAVVAMI